MEKLVSLKIRKSTLLKSWSDKKQFLKNQKPKTTLKTTNNQASMYEGKRTIRLPVLFKKKD